MTVVHDDSVSDPVGDVNRRTVMTIARALGRFSVGLTRDSAAATGTDYIANRETLVVLTLADGRAHTTRELAARSGLSRDATSRLVRRLARAELVERSRGLDDRRGVAVSLTPIGRRRVRQLSVDSAAFFEGARPAAAEIVDLLEAHLVDRAEPAAHRGTDALDLLELFVTVGAELERAVARRVDGTPVSGRQLVCLLSLAEGDGERPSHLAELLEVTSGGVTYILDQLEGRGLITRRHAAADGDRRGVTVTITAAGRGALEPLYAAIAELASRLHAVFFVVARWGVVPSPPVRDAPVTGGQAG